MATTTSIPIEEYLRTSYHPDCDYVNGEVEERNLGEREHARMQGAILIFLARHAKQWGVEALPELRVRISARKVRIPDVCLVRVDLPYERVIIVPPLVVVEVLSPDDRVRRYNERLEDYRQMGVKNIWVVDPETRTGYDWNAGWRETQRFQVADSPVHLDLPAVFASLPE